MYSLSPSNQTCMRKIQTAYISLKIKCEYSITSQINMKDLFNHKCNCSQIRQPIHKRGIVLAAEIQVCKILSLIYFINTIFDIFF